jgi:hypothetical protein
MGYPPIYPWATYLYLPTHGVFIYLLPTYIYKIGTMKSLHESLHKAYLGVYVRLPKGFQGAYLD